MLNNDRLALEGKRKCGACKEEKSFESFYRSKTGRNGFGYRCKPCDKVARKNYREKDLKRAQLSTRKRQLKHTFGMSLEDYQALLNKQGNCCAICKAEKNDRAGYDSDLSFSVDHCHSTGKIRGLLCNRCNRGLGFFEDNEILLQAAIDYLKRVDNR